ncbi:thiamine phosphate synthase [Rhodopila sp.]|jgi:thiamine-phosphate pyrophosphorylase|uniref:thiamine phosphate synthase n=1 Tax=Rhodopila sp. TaxID=2480087 RepID=UPI002C5BB9C9|nr:thiamine phosphate synthase [Rhodopila sp.]HVZ07674.1 thiamine phosphate synthase [Rhodopila sp.]
MPRLWLFTDQARLPDPRPVAARLPAGRAGIVLRHDAAPDRQALGQDLARICRTRRLVLVVAGDARLAARLHAGLHLRAGRWPGAATRRQVTRSGASQATSPIASRAASTVAPGMAPGMASSGMAARTVPITSSAHTVADLVRARRAGVMLAFLSPAFPTASHPGAPGLGPVRWGLMVRQAVPAALRIGALGGVDGRTIHRLPARCVAVGAITAFWG